MTIAPERPAPAEPPRTVHNLRFERSNWEDDAACRDDPRPGDWILGNGDRDVTGSIGGLNRAREICFMRCPVRRDCLKAAVKTGDRHAIRAGMDPKQRDRWLAAQGIGRPRPDRFVSGVPRSDVQPAVVGPLADQGMSFHAIADQFGCSRETVRQRVRTWRAMQQVGAT